MISLASRKYFNLPLRLCRYFWRIEFLEADAALTNLLFSDFFWRAGSILFFSIAMASWCEALSMTFQKSSIENFGLNCLTKYQIVTINSAHKSFPAYPPQNCPKHCPSYSPHIRRRKLISVESTMNASVCRVT